MVSTWLDEHIETFVKPRLGKRALELTADDKQRGAGYFIDRFDAKHMRAIAAVWHQAIKNAAGKRILLAGRDVYVFEILARLDGRDDVIFRPDISSEVAPHVKEDYTDCYLLDTGYKGSVPKAMRIPNYGLIVLSVWPEPSKEEFRLHQVFPNMRPKSIIRKLTGLLEGCPKYWQRGCMMSNPVRIHQEFWSGIQFLEAALITKTLAECYIANAHIYTRRRNLLSTAQADPPSPTTKARAGSRHVSTRSKKTVSPRKVRSTAA